MEEEFFRPITFMLKRIFPTLLLCLYLISCASLSPMAVPAPSASATSAPEPVSWYRDAVFYEIFVRSFKDSNKDGIGDFNGIVQKMDYLESLGVNALWLMPIFPSPSYHGYDVTDYYDVNPQYGSMEDFKNLLDEAHKRDIRVVIDLVINHTSSQHPWFEEANSSPQSVYRDFYIWSPEPKSNLWHQGKDAFYYGYFWEGMPDLNFNNPAVTSEIFKVLSFWLKDVGVDGFRVDAAKHLIEDGDKVENTPATHEWFKGFYTYYKDNSPDA
jgi:glycosidase